jgi:DNA polymerase-3 subunit gamma/tau
MVYQTLYRKYRPKTFSLVYGQDTIVKTLKNIIKNNKLSHAYLFTGPRGTGKTSSAKLFAKAINCINNQDGDACNECENCKSFNNNSNPDIIEIDAASNNGVDEIREIRNKVNLVPSFSKYKVYIIDEVHMLSIGAFNALLKTLEEPPEYVIFILATTEPQKLPTTVVSRCQRFDFKNISQENMKKCLENIIKNENINITDEALDEIIDNSNGGMRDAIGMLDQAFAFCEDKITLDDIQELSGTISNLEITDFFDTLIDIKYDEVIKKIKKWHDIGKDFYLITQKLINYLRTGILYKKKIIYENISSKDKNNFDKISEPKLYLMMDDLLDMLSKLQFNYQKELTFEVEMFKLMDKINVSRGTLQKNNENHDADVPRETLKKINKEKNIDVPRETLEEDKPNDELEQKIDELKNVRINNILMKSSREKLQFINESWDDLNEYLTEEKYKKCAGVLLEGKPVAASDNGIIVTLPLNTLVLNVENNYDLSKELLSNVLNSTYKIVYISNEYWKSIRPKYVELVKNKKLELKDEEYLISQINKIKNNNSVNEFSELIEMEEK